MNTTAKGFTILELLVVITLLVTVMSVVGINLASGRSGAQMKTSARQLVSVLRSTRTQAIAEGLEAGIQVGAAGEADLTLQDAVTSGAFYTLVPSGEKIRLGKKLALTISTGGQRGIVPPRSILFYPDGSASGGRLELDSAAGKMTINVDWLTGAVVLDSAVATY